MTKPTKKRIPSAPIRNVEGIVEQDRYTDRAAQLWCLPQHAKKEMDADFATSIAQALRESAAEAFEEAAVQADGFWINAPGQSRGKALGYALRARAAALREVGR